MNYPEEARKVLDKLALAAAFHGVDTKNRSPVLTKPSLNSVS